jgi:cytochrome P450
MPIVHVEFTEFQKNHAIYTRQCRETGDFLQLDYPGDGLSMYVVADHAGANEVLRNEQGNFVHFADYFASIEQQTDADKRIGKIFSTNLGNNSGLNIELRKDIRNHFNGSGVDQHIDYIKTCVIELAENLKHIAAENDGLVDIMKDFAMPLTFLVTSHIIGLEFDSDEDRQLRIEQASEAIRLINLIAPEADKLIALEAHDKLSEYILPQLQKFCKDDGTLRKDCLFHDFASKINAGEDAKLDSFIELVNGLFQAGLGATGSFFALCLQLLLAGDDKNKAEDIQAYYLSPERTDEEKREAVGEYIRVAQKKLGGIFPRYSKVGGRLKGEDINENSLIYMSLVSANMDENAFKNAEIVNPERVKTPTGLSKEALKERKEKRLEKSLSFSYGEHMCPGRRIALTIIRYAMDELFKQFPNMTAEEINVISEMFGKPSEVTAFQIRLNN